MSAPTAPTATETDRAHGALLGLALGDALGMPTQSMRRADIAARFGAVTGLHDAPADQPIAPGMPAGAVTDDTEQAVLVGRLLVEGEGVIAPRRFADALVAWEQVMVERGSRDLLGPSTKAALTALQAGVAPEEAGRFGTTNGAAMRVAPVGIAFAPGPRLLAAVVQASSVTHNTGLGLSAAVAVGAGVSAGVAGAPVTEALDAAVEQALAAEELGHWVAGASIPRRFLAHRREAATLSQARFADLLHDVVGTSVQAQESVVSALLVADRFAEDPGAGLCLAASLGGDTDTVAAIAGALLGACTGTAGFPADQAHQVQEQNGLDLAGLSADLLALRHRTP